MSKNPKKYGRFLTPLTVYSALRYPGIYPHKRNVLAGMKFA